MISKLTKEQEGLIPVYREKFRAMGLSAGTTADREKVIEETKKFYKACGQDEPKYFIFLDSPWACQIAGNLLKGTKFDQQLGSQLWSQLKSQLRSQLKSQLESQLGSQLWSQLESQLESQLGLQLGSQLESQLESQLGLQLGSQLESQLGLQLESQLKSQLGSQLWSQLESQLGLQLESQSLSWQTQFWGANDAYWLSHWSYIKDILLPNEKTEKLDSFIEISKEVFWWIPYNGIVLYSEKPKYIKWNGQRLHSEVGPAIEFGDGYSLYALNGVTVPEWIIKTPKAELDLEKILQIPNTEQRFAAMRYIGMSKFLKTLKAKEIDRMNDYVLYYISVEERQIGPYLYMRCPSTGREFLEGAGDADQYENIDPNIKTCQDALNWRYGKASRNLVSEIMKELKYRS